MEDGSIEGYSVEELNIDNVNAGKTLFELYDLTGKEKYRKAIDLVYSQIKKMPRTKEGNFWHKNIYPNQVWLDGLYMCQPFYMEYETRFNDKKIMTIFFHSFLMWQRTCVTQRLDFTIMRMIPQEKCSGVIK